jgi:hypothetical protein
MEWTQVYGEMGWIQNSYEMESQRDHDYKKMTSWKLKTVYISAVSLI